MVLSTQGVTVMRPIEWAACVALGTTGGLWNAALRVPDPMLAGWAVLLAAAAVLVTVALIAQVVVTYPLASARTAVSDRAWPVPPGHGGTTRPTGLPPTP